jgi:C1A family cysteine protease
VLFKSIQHVRADKRETAMFSRRSFLGNSTLAVLGLAASQQTSADAVINNNGVPHRYRNFRFGWRPDGALTRGDYFEPLSPDAFASLPATCDLRPKMPEVYDQGEIGSCVPNAVAAAIQYIRKQAKQRPDFRPSRLFLYYNGRRGEDNTFYDTGIGIADCIASIQRFGVCSEDQWPYDDTPANEHNQEFPTYSKAVLRPTPDLYVEARKHKAITCLKMDQEIESIKSCLSLGFPIVFGFRMYEDSFIDPDSGFPRTSILMPSIQDKMIGLHAVLAVGYDDQREVIICRNSWGTTNADGVVQDSGYFYMPYAFACHPYYASDFWTIRHVAALT